MIIRSFPLLTAYRSRTIHGISRLKSHLDSSSMFDLLPTIGNRSEAEQITVATRMPELHLSMVFKP
jgi:hypothetical protein